MVVSTIVVTRRTHCDVNVSRTIIHAIMCIAAQREGKHYGY